MLLPLICSLWLFAPSSYGIEYSNHASLNGGNYTVHWEFNNETEIFHFKVSVKATGWVGFGVSRLSWPANETLQWNRHSMQYYDVFVGGVDSKGEKYYKVRRTIRNHNFFSPLSFYKLKLNLL